MSIPIHVLVDLAEHPNIIGLKEASGDMAYVMDAARLIKAKIRAFTAEMMI